MATFTVSQLNSKESGYTLQDADLLVASIGSSNADLSSVKMSFQQYAENYVFSQYAVNNGITITGGVSAAAGLSAHDTGAWTINFGILPTASTGLQTGDLFTQTKAQILGTGSDATKVLCIV